MAIHMMDPRKVITKNFLDSCLKIRKERNELQRLKAFGPSEGGPESVIRPARGVRERIWRCLS